MTTSKSSQRQKRNGRRLLCFAFSLSPIAAVAADPLSFGGDVDEIIVEGVRLPTPARETGISLSVITDADLERRGYQFGVDALASAPGVTVNQNGAFGGLATVRIRGASSDQTLVLLDGVPVGDPTAVGGGFDFSVLDTSEIERIEILRGPQSTLWGSDAIGGVVNIVSKRAGQGVSAAAFAEGGAFATVRGGTTVTAASERVDFRGGFSRISSDGISKADEDDGNTETDPYDGLTASARLGVNLPADLRFEASSYYNTGETAIDGFPPPNFTFADSPDFSSTEQWTATGRLVAPLFDGRFENVFLAGFTDVTREGNFGGFEALDEGDRLILRYQGAITVNDRIRSAVGAEREEATSNGEDTSIDSVFGIVDLKPIAGLTITGGVRLDDHSRFGSEATGQVRGVYAVTPNVSVRASWGEGFKAPTVFQLTQTFGALPPNGDLEPETSEAFEVGIDAQFGPLSGGVTYFDRDTENLIVFSPDFRYENINETTAKGVEAEIFYDVGAGLSASVNYAYIDAEDVRSGERLIRVPRHSGEAELAYARGPFSGSLVVRYNGDETDGPFGEDVDAWTRVDLAGRYAFSDRLELYGRVENLLDADYQQVSGFGTPGVSGYGGVRVRLGG